jgi:hypothetical protein
MRTPLVTVLAVLASLFITACSTPPTEPAKAPDADKKQRRRGADSYCRFEVYCDPVEPARRGSF